MIDGIRRKIRTRGYSPRTESTYIGWIERFLRFHDCLYWKTLDGTHAEAFLDFLANDAGLAANSRNPAASALPFLYRHRVITAEEAYMKCNNKSAFKQYLDKPPSKEFV
jgi:hypothetical protein